MSVNPITITLKIGVKAIIAGSGGISISNSYDVSANNAGDAINFKASTAFNNLYGGIGNDTMIGSSTVGNNLYSGGGNDTLTGGSGADLFTVTGKGTSKITNLGNGADILVVTGGANVNATIYSTGWTATSDSVNFGTVSLNTAGYAVDVSHAGAGNGWKIIDTSRTLGVTLTGGSNNDTLIGGGNSKSSNNLIVIGGGIDQLTGGTGASNTFNIQSGSGNITNLAAGKDTLIVASGANANATLAATWKATSATQNDGNATLNTKGHAVDISAVAPGAGNWIITDIGAGTTMNGGATNATIIGGNSGSNTFIDNGGIDSLTGGRGAQNTYDIKAGTATISNIGAGKDILHIAAGTSVTATLSDKWAATTASYNDGTVNLITAGHAIDLSKATGSHGFNITDTHASDSSNIIYTQTGAQANTITVDTGRDTVFGFNGPNTISGINGAQVFLNVSGANSYLTSASDAQLNGITEFVANAPNTIINLSNQTELCQLDGATGHNILIGGSGTNVFYSGPADQMTGGSAHNHFIFNTNTTGSPISSSGITAKTLATITNYHVGGSDAIGFTMNYSSFHTLQIGGNANSATSTTAAINQTTGEATFLGAVTDLNVALHDIAKSFATGGASNNTSGDFAFFKLSNTGSEYLYISAGHETTPSAHDNLIQLVGVNSITSINWNSNGELVIIA